MPFPQRGEKLVRVPLTGPLDESQYPGKMARNKLQVAQNVMYRRVNALGKRTGTGPWATNGQLGSPEGILSGYRWYRGAPTVLREMFVQSEDQIWVGNDPTGTFAALTPALTPNSTPAFFDSINDPALNSDIMVVAYGSGPPMRFDGSTFTMLDASITNKFTGVHSWHDHLWFWGDQPGIVMATDLGTPQSMQFCQSFGGYQIGPGDGDPIVQRVISNGNVNFVFKSRSIYTITGYDFSTGEYQFSVQPFSTIAGIPSPQCVAILPNGTIIFWSGSQFYAIPLGAEAPMPIGSELLGDMGVAASGNQNVVRCAAGNFLVQGANGPVLYNDVFLCALDDGSGTAKKICVYDDYASGILGEPAWTVWNGFSVGAFIPWKGPGDLPYLMFGDAILPQVNQLGQNATSDSGNNIQVAVQTIRDDCGTPEQRKRVTRAYLECEAGAAQFTVNVISDQGVTNSQTAALVAPPQGASFGTATFGTSAFGQASPTAYQSPVADIEPELYGKNFTYQILENSSTSVYELISLGLVVYEEALPTQ